MSLDCKVFSSAINHDQIVNSYRHGKTPSSLRMRNYSSRVPSGDVCVELWNVQNFSTRVFCNSWLWSTCFDSDFMFCNNSFPFNYWTKCKTILRFSWTKCIHTLRYGNGQYRWFNYPSIMLITDKIPRVQFTVMETEHGTSPSKKSIVNER